MTEFTVGVEEEYQLVDRDSGELRSRARSVIAADWTGELQAEMQQNTLEVQTRPCGAAHEVREELARLRFQASVAAEVRGLRVVAAGTHPFSHWSGQRFTPGPEYDRIRAEYRRLADTQNIFGLHIHVSVPEEIDRVRLLNVVRLYSHLLLALSASSPLFQGQDTGYASYRWILWRRWPRTGAPPRLEGATELERLVASLVETGCIDGPGRLYWDVRPHHVYPTLEFRVADVTPRLQDAVVITALARAMVAAAADGRLPDPLVPEPMVQTFLVENSWRAARYGTEATFIALEGSGPVLLPAREAILDLAERVEPVASALGDAEALSGISALLDRGDAARRIRARAGDQHDHAHLVRWLADETLLGLGMDRRGDLRDDE